MKAPLAPRSFQTTRWSLVRRASGDADAPDTETRNALTTLCNAYWYPVYTFIRRRRPMMELEHEYNSIREEPVTGTDFDAPNSNSPSI